MSSIILAGVSHHRTPLEMRERLHFPEDAMLDTLDRLAGYGSLDERLLLSTCNRIEVYGSAESFEKGLNAIQDFFAETRGVQPSELKKHLYVHSDAQAVRHLFFVTASLDSMVVGEPQILGQVKDAYRLAHESGHVGKTLTNLFSRAFRVAKKIREQTAIGKTRVSVSSVAVDLANKIFRSLSGRSVLLIGAGEMAEAAARHLKSQGAENILVANRTYSRAQELASRLGGWAVDFENLAVEISKADIVISSTGAPHLIVDKKMAASAVEMRKDAPIFLIDIAVPRDIDPEVNELENVYLYDIDDLQAVVATNLEERATEAEQARSIVEQEIDAYLRRQQSEELTRIFASIRITAESYRRDEIEKTLARFSHFGDKERQALDALTRAIVNKLLHHPFTMLRRLAEEDGTDERIDFVMRLFGIETPDIHDGLQDGRSGESRTHNGKTV